MGRRSRKTPSKTPRRPGKNGGTLLTGNPGNKGGSGRPPNWLTEWCDDQLADPKCKAAVTKILHNPKHPACATMWARVADRAHGKPAQTVNANLRADESLAALIVGAGSK